MKKQQKTETPQNTTNTTKTSPFLDKNLISANKNMKNEANLNSVKLTVNPYVREAYSALQPKNQNGTNPNEANLKPISNTTKPSFQTGNSAKSKTLLLRNKPNFNSLKSTATTCCLGTYNDSQPKTKNGANPNKPNFRQPAAAQPLATSGRVDLSRQSPWATAEVSTKTEGINFKKTCFCTNFALFCYYLTTLNVRTRKNLILCYDTIISYNAWWQ